MKKTHTDEDNEGKTNSNSSMDTVKGEDTANVDRNIRK